MGCYSPLINTHFANTTTQLAIEPAFPLQFRRVVKINLVEESKLSLYPGYCSGCGGDETLPFFYDLPDDDFQIAKYDYLLSLNLLQYENTLIQCLDFLFIIYCIS